MKKVSFAIKNCTPEESERVVTIVNTLLARPIAFQAIFAQICDDLHAGLMLSQLWYWKDTKTAIQRDGWFYKTHAEWTEELFLSRFQQAQARKVLKSKRFIEERFSGAPPKLYYRVRVFAVLDAIIQHTDAIQRARN